MGEARRKNEQMPFKRTENKKISKDSSPRIFSWLPITEAQEQSFVRLTIRGSWIGIGVLVLLWLVVRLIGPAAGWWIPADLR